MDPTVCPTTTILFGADNKINAFIEHILLSMNETEHAEHGTVELLTATAASAADCHNRVSY